MMHRQTHADVESTKRRPIALCCARHEQRSRRRRPNHGVRTAGARGIGSRNLVSVLGCRSRGRHTAGDFHTQNADVYDAMISSVSAEREVTAKAMMTVAWSM